MILLSQGGKIRNKALDTGAKVIVVIRKSNLSNSPAKFRLRATNVLKSLADAIINNILTTCVNAVSDATKNNVIWCPDVPCICSAYVTLLFFCRKM